MGIKKSSQTDSIEEIRHRLEELETTVNRIEVMERAEIEYINAIRDMESEELKGLRSIAVMESNELTKMDKLKPLKYNDIVLWKTEVWDNCPSKVMLESKTIILFNCNISKKACSYGYCPRNIVE
jgi:hypothetical protein